MMVRLFVFHASHSTNFWLSRFALRPIWFWPLIVIFALVFGTVYILAVAFFTLRLTFRRLGSYHHDGPEKLCVIILSYSRPANIGPIAVAALKCDFVEKVVISNNNPDIDLGPLLPKSERIELIQQPMKTRQGVRLQLSRDNLRIPFHLHIDDDCFLSSDQIHRIFAYQLQHPECPVGVNGERLPPPEKIVGLSGYETTEADVRGNDVDVDNLTNVYGLTSEHINRVFELLEMLRISDLASFANGEDVIMSYAGSTYPRLLDAGRLIECPTKITPGIATLATEPGYFEARRALHHRLGEITGRPPLHAARD